MRPIFDSARLLRRRAALVLASAAFAVACGGEGPAPLNDEEAALVRDLVGLYRAELLALAHGGEPDLPPGIPDAAALERRILAEGREPARAALLLRAVHDSLVAFRDELVAAATEGVE